MSCNSCAKPFSFFRKEKGCPGCGFSFCSKCLDNKTGLQNSKTETKVCPKCFRGALSKQTTEPPDVYYKRLLALNNETESSHSSDVDKDHQIQERLLKLKENNVEKIKNKGATDDELSARLQKIKGEASSVTDEQLYERLANLRGIPKNVIQAKPTFPVLDTRTEHEQADDLMKQYLEQVKMDSTYKEEFNELIGGMESRLHKLKGNSNIQNMKNPSMQDVVDSEDEEEALKKIIEKVKSESLLDNNDITPSTNDELPFCEICNEDAKMRCLGCKYLFCKRCFIDHKDEEDGCDRYEPFHPSKPHSDL